MPQVNRTLGALAARFPRKRALVSGAGSGLGLEFSRRLIGTGWSACLLDANEQAVAGMQREFAAAGPRVQCRLADVGDLAALRTATESFLASQSGVDLAISCAGVAVAGPFVGASEQDWQWIYRVNVHGTANACRVVLPHMLQAHSGLIINLASAAAFVSGSEMSAYNSSKAAVVSFTESLAQEYGSSGIQATVAMPGFFKTALLDHARGRPETLNAARAMMSRATIEAPEVCDYILRRAAAGHLYAVLPREYRLLWLVKRLAPTAFPKLFRLLRRAAVARAHKHTSAA